MSNTLIQLEDINIKIKKLVEERTRLENILLDEMIKESGLKKETKYLYDERELVHIVRFELKKFSKYTLSAITCKVKKDGSLGMASHNSWGCNIKYLTKA